jgi:hypothetical protein
MNWKLLLFAGIVAALFLTVGTPAVSARQAGMFCDWNYCYDGRMIGSSNIERQFWCADDCVVHTYVGWYWMINCPW